MLDFQASLHGDCGACVARTKSDVPFRVLSEGIARISMVDDDDEAGAASSSAKPINEDEEEEAELDDIMGGVTTPSSPPAATTTASTAPKRKREETAKGEKQPAARTSVKYFEIEGDTPEELAGAYTTTDVRGHGIHAPCHETFRRELPRRVSSSFRVHGLTGGGWSDL